MKGLKKIALVAAIAAASSAQAELVSMNEAAMGETTGQAGLTIDITSAEISIGEVAYKDEGFIAIKGVEFGGAEKVFGIDGKGDGIFNNVSIMIDVAGDTLDLGRTNLGGNMLDTAANQLGLGQYGEEVSPGVFENNYTDQNINDGDLVISASTTDFTDLLNSVDFNLKIDSIGLGKHDATIGDIQSKTVLISKLDISGFLGPTEIIIDGDDGGMNISTFFNASGSLEMPFMNVKTKFAIHDFRGKNKAYVTPFTQSANASEVNSVAHVQVNIGKATTQSGVEGLAINLQNFDADIDLVDITIGNNSIGSVYITDLHMTANTIIYGH